MNSDGFRFFVDADVDLKKSESEDQHIIRGYASTPDEDRQGDTIIQDGLDISDFVKSGFLNYDHDNKYILGYPTDNTRIDSKGFFVEGVLLKDVPLANHMWDLALALKKSGAPRKIGFSVEGRILKRSRHRIEKAQIFNVAITTNPVNTQATWDAVVKSFNNDKSDDSSLIKDLDAGYGVSPDTQSDGGAFRVEDLENDIHHIAYNLDNKQMWVQVKNRMANGGHKVTKSDAVVYLQLAKGLSRDTALKIAGGN